MSYLYYTLGLGLTLFTIIDLIWTTLWVDGGAGPLSDRLTAFTWKLIKRIDNKVLYNADCIIKRDKKMTCCDTLKLTYQS